MPVTLLIRATVSRRLSGFAIARASRSPLASSITDPPGSTGYLTSCVVGHAHCTAPLSIDTSDLRFTANVVAPAASGIAGEFVGPSTDAESAGPVLLRHSARSLGHSQTMKLVRMTP